MRSECVRTSNWIFLQTRLERIEFAQFRFLREAVLQLAERGEETCSVRLQISVLTAQTELNREPEALNGQKIIILSMHVTKED